jgi:RNA polymerase sigma-70 factor (ECF subfamily)
MVTLRYFDDMEIEAVADRIKSTVAAVYRALSRVRYTLMECVNKQLKQEAAV